MGFLTVSDPSRLTTRSLSLLFRLPFLLEDFGGSKFNSDVCFNFDEVSYTQAYSFVSFFIFNIRIIGGFNQYAVNNLLLTY